MYITKLRRAILTQPTTFNLARASVRRKIARSTLYNRIYAMDGAERNPDEYRAAVNATFKTFAAAAELPDSSGILVSDIDNFLDVGCYIISIEGAEFTPLEIDDDLQTMGKKFGAFIDLDESLVYDMVGAIRRNRVTANVVHSPDVSLEDLTDDEKKGAARGKKAS